MDASGLASMAAMALGIALASVLVVRWITRPLRRLADAADTIGTDLRARPLPEDGPEEVRHAALAFNAMQGRIRRLVEARTEALAAMSHDLRTPLSRLKLRAGFLPEGEDRARIEADIAEMEAMVARTLDYIREGRDAEPARPADLAAILQTLASDATDAGNEVAYDGPARAVLPLWRRSGPWPIWSRTRFGTAQRPCGCACATQARGWWWRLPMPGAGSRPRIAPGRLSPSCNSTLRAGVAALVSALRSPPASRRPAAAGLSLRRRPRAACSRA